MARPRKSSAYHELNGTEYDGARDRSDQSPSVHKSGRPSCPKFLSKVGKKEFRRQVRLLSERRTLTASDGALLAIHCVNHERLVAALEEIRMHGQFEVVDGVSCESAASKLATRLTAQLRLSLTELGATPRQREKVKPTQPSDDDLPARPGSIEDLLRKQEAGLLEEAEEIAPVIPPTSFDDEEEN